MRLCLIPIALFTFLKWKIQVTRISVRANGKALLCLGESVTAKDRDGLTETCSGGKPTQIFGCNEIDREIIGFKKNSKEPTEFKAVFVSGTPSDFGAFQQPIKFIVVGSTVVEFGGKASKRSAVSEFNNSQ
jgi:hypothetical protein